MLPRASDEPAWRAFVFGSKRLRKAEGSAVVNSTAEKEEEEEEEAALNELEENEEWMEEDEEVGINELPEEEGEGEEELIPEDELEPFDPSRHAPKEPTLTILQSMPDVRPSLSLSEFPLS